MRKSAVALGLAAGLLTISACDRGGGAGNQTGQTPAASKAAGSKTIAAGLPGNSRFIAAAKAAGIDKTLAGPGPYTVLVPADAAFDKVPGGMPANAADPTQRAKITSILTYLILPGTVLTEDIGKTIDAAKGKATMMTVGGQTFTASREGGQVVLTDSAGNKARITKGDEEFSNGVVHHIDAVLAPPAPSGERKAQ